MTRVLSGIQPEALWKHFEELNEVPRPSKKEERVIAFAKEFGESLGFPTEVDAVGNVLIKKPATPGMENRVKVILQSHLDMVHQKNADTVFDFNSEGIKMLIDGDWIKADGTTLGADNGIGVASIMALLTSTDIPHPTIEALFTIDEETGMTGAFGLQPGFLSGQILLNLDTEDDDELTIGCAGGVNITIEKEYNEVTSPDGQITKQIKLSGLSGGHSGMDIIKSLGNANKLMNRLLYQLDQNLELSLHSIQGGGLRNAIPRESLAKISFSSKQADLFSSICKRFEANIKAEYEVTDPHVKLEIETCDTAAKRMSPDLVSKILRAIYAAPDGIYKMSSTVPGMVQTSNNIAQVKLENGKFSCLCLCRSSVDSEKDDEVRAIRSAFSSIDGQVQVDGDYPGWTPKAKSEIVSIMAELYTEMFNGNAKVMACHAGLECGIIGAHYPSMDMVSFGPNIRGAHSPDEKVQISSVQKYWGFLLETLKRIPVASNG